MIGASTVTDILREDHRNVKGLFKEFEQTDDANARQRAAKTAMTELEIHSKLEEELVYPAIQSEIDDDELMDEALEEHHAVHGMIEELKKLKQRDEGHNAKFTELTENVKHHIQEEESKMLTKAEDCEIDWEALSSQVVKRKKQLTAKMASKKK